MVRSRYGPIYQPRQRSQIADGMRRSGRKASILGSQVINKCEFFFVRLLRLPNRRLLNLQRTANDPNHDLTHDRLVRFHDAHFDLYSDAGSLRSLPLHGHVAAS